MILTTCFEKHDEWNLNGITRFIFKSKLLWIIDYQVFLHNYLFINPVGIFHAALNCELSWTYSSRSLQFF